METPLLVLPVFQVRKGTVLTAFTRFTGLKDALSIRQTSKLKPINFLDIREIYLAFHPKMNTSKHQRILYDPNKMI